MKNNAADFLPCSYGFRPKRSTTMALESLRKLGAKGGHHVLDADISGYFGSIDHDKLMRVRQRVKELTPGSRCHAELRDVIADLNPLLRGWGNYFQTGNASKRFNQLDTYVWRRLRSLRVKRKGRHLRPGEWERWSPEYFHEIGLHRLRGTVRYPEQAFFHREAASCSDSRDHR